MYAEDLYGIFAFFGIFLIFLLLASVLIYILGGIGLMKVADREGVENSWLAFIPIANLYVLGKAAQSRVGFDNLHMWLLGGFFASLFSGFIPIIGFLIPIANYILFIYTVHKLFEKYTNKAVILTVIGILTGLQYLFLFFIRNNQEVN